jgi:hypothetical protein
MKCVSTCTFNEKPESTTALVRHVEGCSAAAPADEKMVVWRNGELVVVSELEEDDNHMSDISFKVYEFPSLESEDVPVQESTEE